MVALKQRLTERTHGDIERPAALWRQYIDAAQSGHIVVERSEGGPIRSFAFFEQSHHAHLDTVRVTEALYEDLPALKRLLGFLGSLRDQYSFATLLLPADLRLNWLLAEKQMTHRQNRNHATAEARPFTRMQVRVLDHAKLIGAMKLTEDVSGKAVVAIHESEGGTSRFAIEVAEGRAVATPTDASPQLELADRDWATVVFGDIPASRAAEMGLITVDHRTPLAVLDAFAAGPAPFCREYF